MGKAEREKGYRGERNLVNALKKFDFEEPERVPLSGASRYSKSNKGDLTFLTRIDNFLKKFRGEVKVRGDGFKELYAWLFKEKDTNILFVKADYKPYLVVMTLDEFVGLCKRKEDVHVDIEDDQCDPTKHTQNLQSVV